MIFLTEKCNYVSRERPLILKTQVMLKVLTEAIQQHIKEKATSRYMTFSWCQVNHCSTVWL